MNDESRRELTMIAVPGIIVCPVAIAFLVIRYF